MLCINYTPEPLSKALSYVFLHKKLITIYYFELEIKWTI